MFELLFQYPLHLFAKGEFALLSGWPVWVLVAACLAASAVLGFAIRSKLGEAASGIRGLRPVLIWFLQSLLACLLLLLLWKPALMVSELKPQQNIVSVLIDDSHSMGLADGGSPRREQAVKLLEDGTLTQLQRKFQVRLYSVSSTLQRIKGLDEIKAQAPSTRLGDSLRQVAAESAGLPVGAVLLLSDGSDNSGGIDLETITELRSRRIPVHTVGFGAEKPARDIEITDVQVAPRALADSRLAARITFQQTGFSGQKAKIHVKDGSRILASHPVTLDGDGSLQTEMLLFNVGQAGARALSFSLDALSGEENQNNNAQSRLVNVEAGKRRILFIDGEPRWEFKFIRRSVDNERVLQLVSMLRTTQNKVYRQGIENPGDLAEGFPAKVEELFSYHAIVIGAVEFSYFTQNQQELLRQFVDRRGGGLLFLAGRNALADGGWSRSSLADLLPVVLPERKGTFKREPATADLTPMGAESLICRLVEDPGKNVERWKKLPPLMDHQDVGLPKPGASVLADMNAAGKRIPLLVTQSYGRGRTAVLATSGTWRWQMSQPLADQTHETFWQQLLRWLASDTPGRVSVSTPRQMLFDEGRVVMQTEVRDKNFLAAADTRVEARILGPAGIAVQVELAPDRASPGLFSAEYIAEKPGAYLAEITAKRGEEEVVRDVLTFQRQDGVAENFRTYQNRDLLEKLSSQTGGRYWTPKTASKLATDIAYSEAGITVRTAKDLWSMPIVFLLIILIRGAEWLLRRKWGVV